jgi:hypothetical protein
LAFQNHYHIRDAHRFGVNPGIDLFEKLCCQPTICLLCPHMLPTIPGHNISGQKSLVRDPTPVKTYKSPGRFKGAMSESDTMLSVVIIQVMQDAKSYHDVCISESPIIPKRLCVADYEDPLLVVRPFGRSNVRGIGIEPKILDLREPRKYLRWTAPNIDDLVTGFGSNMLLNKLSTQRVSPNRVLKQIVQPGSLQPTLQSRVTLHCALIPAPEWHIVNSLPRASQRWNIINGPCPEQQTGEKLHW